MNDLPEQQRGEIRRARGKALSFQEQSVDGRLEARGEFDVCFPVVRVSRRR